MCRVSKFCLNSQDMFVRALKWMKWVYVRALGQLDTSNATLKAKRLPPSATPPAFQPWNQEEEDVDHAICEEGIIETNCFCCFHLKLSGKNSDKAIFTLFSGPFIGGYQNLTLTPPPSHRIFVAEIEEKYVQICPLCCSDSLMQGGRTWQPFVGSKNGNENFRQTRIFNFCVKCVVFAHNRKFAKSTHRNMHYIPCNSALLAQETLFLTQKGTFLPKDLQKVRKSRQI